MNDIYETKINDCSVVNAVWGGLTKLYFENKMFDITLLAKGGEIYAHKVVLASVSTYFKLLLTSELTSKNVCSVDLSFCDLKILSTIINFIYTGEISLNPKNIFHITEIQDYLGIAILRHHITHYMLTSIEDNNCWAYHEISERHSLKDVFVKVDRYIRSNFQKLISGGKTEYLNVSANQLLGFLDSDFLNVSNHEKLLVSLCEWMGFSPEDRLTYMEPLLSHVDIGRILSWRGMTKTLAACFPPQKKHIITEWSERIQEQRVCIERKKPLKVNVQEVILMIGGIVDNVIVPSVDVCLPPRGLSRVIPKGSGSDVSTIIPSMICRRFKPTAVASDSSVYVLGGVQRAEEFKADGIFCEVYRIKENKWYLLPNLPPNKTPKIMSFTRRPPAAYVEGNLYATQPSPVPSFWILSRNETCWSQLPSPKCYEVFDLVGVNGVLYCIGSPNKSSRGRCMAISFTNEYTLERYDALCEFWIPVSTFFLDSSDPKVKGLCLENTLCIASSKEWLRFDPCKCQWEEMEMPPCGGDELPALCSFKDKQVVCVRDFPSSLIGIISSSGMSQFSLPFLRSSATLASISVPVYRPEPI